MKKTPDLCPLCRLKSFWKGEPPWDADVMLYGVDPGDPDPGVPSQEDFVPCFWRAVIDAEGELLCLVPNLGPYDQEGWPDELVKILNAMHDVVSPNPWGESYTCRECGAEVSCLDPSPLAHV